MASDSASANIDLAPGLNLVTIKVTSEDGTNGNELWVSDGTNTGTQMLGDTNTSGNSVPLGLTVFDGYLYFEAVGTGTGMELWWTSGSAPEMLLDINAGSANGVSSFGPSGAMP